MKIYELLDLTTHKCFWSAPRSWFYVCNVSPDFIESALIEAWTKWLTISRQHFQMHFLEVELLCWDVDSNFAEICLIDNKLASVEVMAWPCWCQTSDKPLSELVSLCWSRHHLWCHHWSGFGESEFSFILFFFISQYHSCHSPSLILFDLQPHHQVICGLEIVCYLAYLALNHCLMIKSNN